MSKVGLRGVLTSPAFWLGIGIGLLAGVSAVAGLGFSKADGARFLGALLGSIIAVGGAVSLYYLKLREDRSRMRAHVLRVAENGWKQCINCQTYIERGEIEPLRSSLMTLSLFIDRIQSYLSKFEFDDELVSDAAPVFDRHFSNDIIDFMDDPELDTKLDVVDAVLEFQRRCFRTVADVLEGKAKFDIELLQPENSSGEKK